jgi:hypothetical protein
MNMTNNHSVSGEEDYDISEYSRASQDKRTSEAFADYMQLHEIKDGKKYSSSSKVVGAEYIVSRDTKVEVMKGDDAASPLDKHPVTVLVHRDEENDMRSIEVVCTCGKRTLIALEYDDLYDDE